MKHTHTKKHNKRPNKKINRKHALKTRKQRRNPQKIKILKNKTPRDILRLSKEIASNLPLGSGIRDLDVNKASSYSPTINDDLVTLKSIPREKLADCNNILAFQLKEPLKISVPGKLFGKSCLPYDDQAAKDFLLKNLSANKHIDAAKVVPPIQIKAN